MSQQTDDSNIHSPFTSIFGPYQSLMEIYVSLAAKRTKNIDDCSLYPTITFKMFPIHKQYYVIKPSCVHVHRKL